MAQKFKAICHAPHTHNYLFFGFVAQLAEQVTLNDFASKIETSLRPMQGLRLCILLGSFSQGPLKTKINIIIWICSSAGRAGDS